MTRKQQRTIISVSIIFGVLLFLQAVIVVLLVYFEPIRGAAALFAGMFIEIPVTDMESAGPFGALLPQHYLIWAVFGKVLLGLAVPFFLHLYFRKTISPEIFFFMLALLCLCFESFRLVNWFILHLYGTVNSVLFLSRVVYFSKVVGVFSLFLGGVFANGLSPQKQGLLLNLALLAAFVVLLYVPMDMTEIQWYFLVKVSDAPAFIGALLIIQLLSVINYFIGAYHNSNRDYLFIGLGAFLFVLGRNLLFFLLTPWSLPLGFICIMCGTYLFARKIYAVYLWQ